MRTFYRTSARGAMLLAGLMAGVAGLGTGSHVAAQDAPGGKTSLAPAGEGKELYEQICQACHMAEAQGGMGAGTGVPALAHDAKLANKAYPITILLNGKGGMPRFADMLTPAQIAAVLTYVRGHFNAYADPVREEEVKRIAAATVSSPDCDCAH